MLRCLQILYQSRNAIGGFCKEFRDRTNPNRVKTPRVLIGALVEGVITALHPPRLSQHLSLDEQRDRKEGTILMSLVSLYNRILRHQTSNEASSYMGTIIKSFICILLRGNYGYRYLLYHAMVSDIQFVNWG